MSPSEMSEAMNAVSNMDAASDPGTTGGIDAPASSYSDSNYNPFAGFDRYADEPNVGTAYLGLDTPVYGSSGMNARNAINALIDMQAYPYVPGPASPNIDSLRGIPSWAMLSEDPQYGFRGVEAPAIPDRSPNYAYGMEDYPVDRVVTRPDFAPATQPTATASGRELVTGYPPGDYGQSIFQTLNRGIPGVTTNTSGKSELQALVDAGLGKVTGLNPNNPDQTAQQLLNSFRANDFLTEYGPSLFTAGLPPGMAFAFNAIRSGANVLSGRTTPGQALMGVGLDALASKLGIPGGGRVVGDLLEGRVGSAAGRAASGLATGALGRAGLGAFAPIVAKETGLGPAIQKSVSGAVQRQAGQGTGFVSSITDAINRGPQGIMGLFGGTSSAPIPATPGVTTPTRAYTTPDFNPYESGGNEPPAVATAPTTPAATTPEVTAARRLLYGMAQGPYGPLLAYDFGEA